MANDNLAQNEKLREDTRTHAHTHTTQRSKQQKDTQQIQSLN